MLTFLSNWEPKGSSISGYSLLRQGPESLVK